MMRPLPVSLISRTCYLHKETLSAKTPGKALLLCPALESLDADSGHA
jgi:hypothetical protein